METHPARSHDEIEMLLLQHVRALRGHPDLKDSDHILPREQLGSGSFSHGAHGERRTEGVHVLRKRQSWRVRHMIAKKSIPSTACSTSTGKTTSTTPCRANPRYRDANERPAQVKKEFKNNCCNFKNGHSTSTSIPIGKSSIHW